MERIDNLAAVSDDPVLLTTRPGAAQRASAFPWLRLTTSGATADALATAEQTALREGARGVIANRVLNPGVRERYGWHPWHENDDMTAVYETPIGLLMRLGVEGLDPRSGLDPEQLMAPGISLVEQLRLRLRESEPTAEKPAVLVLPGSCGGGKWHVHEDPPRTIRFTKLVLGEIPYLADVVALALQFASSALGYGRVEVPGDCVLYANVTSRSGIFVELTPEQEDAVATGEDQFRALRAIAWPVEGGPLEFRASLMLAPRAARLELVRFSRPETRPSRREYGELSGESRQLLPSVYAPLELDPPHPLTALNVRLKAVAPLWDLLWRETLFRAHLRPGERAHSVESHLHVHFGLDSRIHVHDVTHVLDQQDRDKLRREAAEGRPREAPPTRVLELTDYRHPLSDSQPAVRHEIIKEIETLINVVEAAQTVMTGLAVLFTRPIIDMWRRMMGLREDDKAIPEKLHTIGGSTNLWRV